MSKNYKNKKFKNFNRAKNNEFNAKQLAFIEMYVQTNNSYKSAEHAGYSGKYGYTLIQDKRIMEKIKERKQQVLADRGIIENDIINKYVDIAFSDIGNYVEIENNEVKFRNTKNIDTSIIKEISNSKDSIKIKLEDKMTALKFLAESFNLDPLLEFQKLKLKEGQKTYNMNHNTDNTEKEDIETWFNNLTDDEKLLSEEELEKKYNEDNRTHKNTKTEA